MNSTVKATLGIAITAFIAFLIAVYSQYWGTPQPTPSPSPSPSLTPPTPSPTLVTGYMFYAMKGEILGPYEFTALNSQIPTGVTVFTEMTVTLTKQSYVGAPTGMIVDPLVPTSATAISVGTKYMVDIAIPAGTPAGVLSLNILGNAVQVNVVNLTMPVNPTIPMYSELTLSQVAKAHGYGAQDGSMQSAIGALMVQYNAMLRAHLIEPVKNWAIANPSNLDTGSANGMSFRQLVLTGNISPPCISGPNASASSITNLAMISAAAPTGFSWSGDELNDTQGAAALAAVHAAAPNVKQFVTDAPTAALAPLANMFCIVMDEFPPPLMPTGPYCEYASCEGVDSCDGVPGTPTGTPMVATLGVPPVNQRAFAVVAYATGATTLLYYDTTYSLPTAWAKDGQYAFGNQGDGELLLPGGGSNPGPVGPIATLRLKYIRQGRYDTEWLIQAKKLGITVPIPVTSTKVWSKDMTAYDAMRIAIYGAMNAK